MRSSSFFVLVATAGAAVVSAASFIVSLEPDLTTEETAQVKSDIKKLGWEILYDYEMLEGYAISGEGDVAEVEAIPNVALVMKDLPMTTLDGGDELPA